MGTALPPGRPRPARPERKLDTKATTYVFNVSSLARAAGHDRSVLPF
jgi:hypothetical protein